MITTNDKDKIIRIFSALRKRGVNLGLRDLLTGLRLLEPEWRKQTGELGLLDDLCLLWCYSSEQIRLFENIIKELEELEEEEARSKTSTEDFQPEVNPPKLDDQESTPVTTKPGRRPTPEHASESSTRDKSATGSDPGAAAVPFSTPVHSGKRRDMSIRRKLTALEMCYAWQKFSLCKTDGSLRDIDIEKTIGQVARTGFFAGPVLRRSRQNNANLIMFIDRRGSMSPFHPILNELVSTAESAPEIRHLKVFYFHDVIKNFVYNDPLLNKHCPIDSVFEEIPNGLQILIVSDAGAARGELDASRMVATKGMLDKLREHSSQIAWLNPMPESRWKGTTAQVVGVLAKMFPLDQNGMSRAIKFILQDHAGRA
jgi:uncharacterized protein with von Willebrand factor type A (vWA) domain